MAELLDNETRRLASVALGAYNAMETTKRRHFDYLNLLEAKRKKFNLEASSKESAILESLLTDHDISVSYFKMQAAELKTTAPDAHLALFKYIGFLNDIFDDSAVTAESHH